MTVSRLYHIASGLRSAHATPACKGRVFAFPVSASCMGTEIITFFHRELTSDGLCVPLELKRFASTSRKSDNSALSETKESDSHVTVSLGEKVKQTTKDASYLGVIIAGIGVTGLMFYAIFRELFSGHSPNSVYTKAFKKVKQNEEVIAAVGEPIKGYGELSSRGRRRHVSHMEYVKDGVNHMRMKFYIEGSRKKGTVNVEVRENEEGKYDYRYLFVDLKTTPTRTIILEDNRLNDISISL